MRAFAAKAESGKKLGDGNGLFLFITSTGSAIWRIKYRIDGKEKLYAVGPYPAISLDAARIELGEVKALLREHKDPVIERRLNRSAALANSETTLQVVANEWLMMKQKEWSDGHLAKSRRALERDVYPTLGNLPIARITPAIVAKLIENINKRDVLETATRILQHLNGIFRYAQAKGLCRDNPALPAKEILPRKKNVKHMAALLDFASLGDVLRRAEAARLSPPVRVAHRLMAFTGARIGNIVEAEWREFDLDSAQALWVIPREKMKMKSRPIDHRIPLCREITAELRIWRQIFGDKGFMFPSPSGNEHISRESLEKAYRVTLRLSEQHTPHGWRSALSTLARDEGFARDVVELALDHIHDNEVARAYDRGERFAERIRLFSWWGTQLTAAQQGATVTNFHQKVS